MLSGPARPNSPLASPWVITILPSKAEVYFRKRLRVRVSLLPAPDKSSSSPFSRLKSCSPHSCHSRKKKHKWFPLCAKRRSYANAGIVGFDAASRPVVCSGASLALAMPRHFGSVSERSAIPGIVVLRKTPDDVPQFVKQYRDLRFWGVSVVTRNRQHAVTSGPRERSPLG